MNYVITYWVPPGTSEARKDTLRLYFDLQRETKARFGGHQTIVTNIDYRGAVPFLQPTGFLPQHGIIAKWIGLGQMIHRGMKFPIMMHDHDVFIRASIAHDPDAICSAYAKDGYISDQIVLIPEKCKNDVINYVNRLLQFTFHGTCRSGYGCEVRHEGRYSSESIQINMNPKPFATTPMKSCINIRDLVSFDIKNRHSLDPGNSDCNPIPDDAQAVHGHLNRGKASQLLMAWLNRKE